MYSIGKAIFLYICLFCKSLHDTFALKIVHLIKFTVLEDIMLNGRLRMIYATLQYLHSPALAWYVTDKKLNIYVMAQT